MRHQDLIAGRRTALNDQRDAAIGYRALALVPGRKPNAIDGDLDCLAFSLEDEVIGSLKGPLERCFREDGRLAVPRANQPQDIRSHQKDRVKPSQTLHANADPCLFGKMDGERRLDPIIAPLPAAMNDHAFAAVL